MSQNRKKIIIIGEMYSDNLGDGIICETVKKYFEKDFEIRILDISGREQFEFSKNFFNLWKENYVYFKYIFKKILYKYGYDKCGKNLFNIVESYREKFFTLLKEFKPYAIIFAGGQMFIDSFSKQINFTCDFAEKNNIKVIFNSCGLGEIMQKKDLIDALNKNCVKYISVRDNFDICQNYTSKKVVDTYDTAILCNRVYDESICRSEEILGVGIMFSTLQNPLIQVKFWKKLIKKLYENKIDFKVFTNGSTKDQSFAAYILNKLKLPVEKYLIDQPKYPVELIKNISKFNSIISMRLHSLIVAYSFNIPTIAISWDNKVNAFFKKIRYNNKVYNFNSNIDNIIEELKGLSKEKYDIKYREKIEKNIINNIKNIKNI